MARRTTEGAVGRLRATSPLRLDTGIDISLVFFIPGPYKWKEGLEMS